MEKEAYLKGNMLFRDWEDSCKKQMQMEDKNKMKLSELKKIIKETIKDIVSEDWGGSKKKPGGASFIGDGDDAYKQRNPGRNSTHRPLMTNTEADKSACMQEIGHLGYDYRECLKAKARARLEEADGEQQIEEEIIDEAGCDSHGKREDEDDKAVKENEEVLSEGTKEYDGSHDAWDRAKKHCLSGFTAGHDGTEEGRTQCMISLGHHPTESGMPWEGSRSNTAPSSHAPRGQKQRLEDPTLTRASRSIKNQSYGLEESKVMTPEKEKALKENYMGEKRNRLFEKLTKKWTK